VTVLDELTTLANWDSYPQEALEAVKTILVHDLAVARSAACLLSDLLDEPQSPDGHVTDIMTGAKVSAYDAVARNGSLIHAFTQDDTLLPAMTHVGATSIPLLLALGEEADTTVGDLLQGLAASFSAALSIGGPVAIALAARGVRPTPVIGPLAAQVGAARMLGWTGERMRRGLGGRVGRGRNITVMDRRLP
jgi:2-methylcitrate dehydratase PrpD